MTETVRGMKERPRIAVFGNFGAGNLGNECTLYALLQNLRDRMPKASFLCICSGPEEIAAAHHVAAFPIRQGRLPRAGNFFLRALAKVLCAIPLEVYRWWKVISIIKGSDMLLMTGTGMLSDVGITPFGLHYDILRWSAAARLCRCKLLFVSVGAGPIRRPLSRRIVKTALALANYRSYRDQFSRDYMESIHFKRAGDEVYPDLAFSLPRNPGLAKTRRPDRRSVVGLGVITHSRRRATAENDPSIYRRYIERLADFAAWLLEQNHTVRLLIGDVAYDGPARADLRRILESRGWTGGEAELIDKPAQSFEMLLAQLAQTDIVVASRFHNVLLAVLLNKPVVAISFHEKVDALMSAAGLESFCLDIENVDVDRLKQQFTDAEENANELKLKLERTTENYRRSLDRQYTAIVRMAGSRELVPA